GMDSPASQHARAACSSKRIAGSKHPGIYGPGEARILQQRRGFVLQQAVGNFKDHKSSFAAGSMRQQGKMQMEEFIQVAQISGGQAAIHKIESLAGSGVQHAERVLSAGCAGEFDPYDAMSILPQPLDDAGDGARLAGIHGSAADDHDTRPQFYLRRRERELAKTQL